MAELRRGTAPTPRHFPTRNQIIASLALGFVVIDAAAKSGSLITGREAGERGSEVMAIPRSPLDPRSNGCNQLIRDGVILMQNGADIMAAVASTAPLKFPLKKQYGLKCHKQLLSTQTFQNAARSSFQGLAANRLMLTIKLHVATSHLQSSGRPFLNWNWRMS